MRSSRSHFQSAKPEGTANLRMSSLEDAFRYENDQILLAFMDQYAVSMREATEVFSETKKLVWLLCRAQRDGVEAPAHIAPHVPVLDEMWQAFVLFTPEYRQYCDAHFGTYIDHTPQSGRRGDPRDQRVFRELVEAYREQLGAQTLTRWLRDYPRRYSLARLELLRRKQFVRRETRRARAFLVKPAARATAQQVTIVKRILPRVGEPPSLDRALDYDNDLVASSFMDKYAVTRRQARALFTEMKKYLWLIAVTRHRGIPTPFISNELIVIDEMWHAFVLCTADYRTYCLENYGFYIDHLPGTMLEEAAAVQEHLADPAAALQRWRADLHQQLSVIYDHLGRRTVMKWYKTLPGLYSRERLEHLRRQQSVLD